ncbi:MAG: XTP/dITP diphosphatase [Deltaproteobacteria bacterium]|nr:XTP/dITP diphosphatase [Deltaproteobacteria bacterium]
MKKIVLASRNRGKISEIGSMLEGSGIHLRSLLDYPDFPDIMEDGNSFLENALKKARVVSEWTGETVLADDSGLEVDALGGAPGIYSARYAGEDGNDEKNIRKLLDEMKNVASENRGATFRCILVLYSADGRYETFEGHWKGLIAEKPVGQGGFGYDPVFYLPEERMTVAQLSSEVKNRISHRAQAIAKLKERFRKG